MQELDVEGDLRVECLPSGLVRDLVVQSQSLHLRLREVSRSNGNLIHVRRVRLYVRWRRVELPKHDFLESIVTWWILQEVGSECEDDIARVDQICCHSWCIWKSELSNRASDCDNAADPLEWSPDGRRLRHSHVVYGDLRTDSRFYSQSIARHAHERSIKCLSRIIYDLNS